MKKKTAFMIAGIAIIILCLSITALLSNIDPNTVNPPPDTTPTAPPNTPIPTASPSPTASPTTTHKPTPAPTPLRTPIPTSAPTATPTPTDTPSPTPEPTETPSPTPIPTATPSPTPSPTPIPVPSPSPMPTPNPATVLFSDNFQSGNMNAWTSTDTNGVTLGVTDSMLECSANTPTNENWGYLYKWLNQTYTSLDWRWYVYFSNLPTTNGNIVGAGGIYNSAVEGNFTAPNIVASVSVIRLNGASYWSLGYADNSTVYNATLSSTVLPNTWYLLELKAGQGAGDGEVQFYLNDVEVFSTTGLTNNNNTGIDHVSIGGGITADQPVTWYCAGAIAAIGYVGPEPSITPFATVLNGQAVELPIYSNYIASALTFGILSSFLLQKYLARSISSSKLAKKIQKLQP